MPALQHAISVTWIIFLVYWLLSAIAAKPGVGSRLRFPLTGVSVIVSLLLVRVFATEGLAVHSRDLATVGAVVFASGISLAIWARVHLGRNWGMPMSQKAEPELVTTGPYRFVRHPIYTGLLAGVVGTALATNLIDLIIVAILGAAFYHSASVEEHNLTATFPTTYPAFRERTNMLIPFVHRKRPPARDL